MTAGEGFYQENGSEARVLKKGDCVRIPPNVIHWHGASQRSWFSHLSIETNSQSGSVKWLESVDELIYGNAHKQFENSSRYLLTKR